jgi:hypothetical protein
MEKEPIRVYLHLWELSEDSTHSSLEVQAKVRDIHSALSNSDSLRIFNLAAEGIDASTSVLEKYQFTKKRYYGRLKELVDLGLVFKNGGEYKHTSLGSTIFDNQVKNLEQILVKKNNLEVINELKKNREADSKDKMSSIFSGELIIRINWSCKLASGEVLLHVERAELTRRA